MFLVAPEITEITYKDIISTYINFVRNLPRVRAQEKNRYMGYPSENA